MPFKHSRWIKSLQSCVQWWKSQIQFRLLSYWFKLSKIVKTLVRYQISSANTASVAAMIYENYESFSKGLWYQSQKYQQKEISEPKRGNTHLVAYLGNTQTWKTQEMIRSCSPKFAKTIHMHKNAPLNWYAFPFVFACLAIELHLYTHIYRIMYVLAWRTDYALTRRLFWCLFPELLVPSTSSSRFKSSGMSPYMADIFIFWKQH